MASEKICVRNGMPSALGRRSISNNPHVSVVIPHLNQPEPLRRCLAALEEQQGDGVPFEAIVVDNGSRTLPEALVADFPFARLKLEATPGPGPARNHGARLARGSILAFIDADCFAQAGWIAGIAAYFDVNPAIEVIGGDVRIARGDDPDLTAIEAFESIYGYRFELYVRRDKFSGAGNMAVRRETFQKVGDFGGIGIAEDKDWGQRATTLGVRIDYVPEMRVETPARESFAELTRKWDRHIAHDFAELSGRNGSLRWCLRAMAVAASPLAELPEIALTDRVTSMRERWLALTCLTKIRLYRAWRMLALLLSGDGAARLQPWRDGL